MVREDTNQGIGGIRNFYTIYSNGAEELRVNSGKANRLTSVKLNNQTYNGVIFELEDQNIAYVQKYVGVIGWKKDNDTFNLIRYNIVP